MDALPRIRGRWTLAVLLTLPVLAACETTHTTRMVPPAMPLVTKTEAVRSWALVEDGVRRGWVVQFEDPDEPTREYYSVRNEHHQELGSLDEHGRAWAFVPHQREAEWVGTGTVLEGARAILRLGAGAVLEEVALEAVRGH